MSNNAEQVATWYRDWDRMQHTINRHDLIKFLDIGVDLGCVDVSIDPNTGILSYLVHINISDIIISGSITV